MDNVTHTLVGVLVGETAANLTKPSAHGLSRDQRRALFVTTMAIGSNLPDLDFLYSTVTGSKLDYLLHHRGHTHTFVGAFLLAAMVWLAYELWAKRRGRQLARADRVGLVGVAVLAPVLHILMDMTNSYGVHPWWPFDNRWIYGDSVFIVEPLLWAAAAPTLFLLRTWIARTIVSLVLLAGIALTFYTGLVPIPLAATYTALVAALVYAGWKLPPRSALICGLSVWLVATAGFIYSGHRAAQRIEAIAKKHFREAPLVDHVLTPMPVNPICWEAILIHVESPSIVLRRAMLSMLPGWIPAAECPSRNLDGRITAPVQPTAAGDSARIKWHGEVRSDAETLRRMWRENCQANALLRFGRAPWLAITEDTTIIGDLRYDRERALGFAELEVDRGAEPCPRLIPDWVPPRRDVLETERDAAHTSGS